MTPDELDQETSGEPCDACCQTGWNVNGRWLWVVVNYLELIAQDAAPRARGLRPHPWLRTISIAPKRADNPMAIALPTEEFGRLVKGLSGGADSDPFMMIKKIVEAAGLPEEWPLCGTCGGAGEVPLKVSSNE